MSLQFHIMQVHDKESTTLNYRSLSTPKADLPVVQSVEYCHHLFSSKQEKMGRGRQRLNKDRHVSSKYIIKLYYSKWDKSKQDNHKISPNSAMGNTIQMLQYLIKMEPSDMNEKIQLKPESIHFCLTSPMFKADLLQCAYLATNRPKFNFIGWP